MDDHDDKCVQEVCDVCGGDALFDNELDHAIGAAILEAIAVRKVPADKVLVTVAKALTIVSLLKPGDSVTVIEHDDALEVQVHHRDPIN